MTILLDKLNWFLSIGIKNNTETDLRHRIKVCNVISLLGLANTLPLLAFFAYTEQLVPTIAAIIPTIVYTINPFLNHAGFNILSRMLIPIAINVAVLIASYGIGSESGIWYYFFCTAIIPFMIFIPKEVGYLIVSCLQSVAAILGLKIVDYLAGNLTGEFAILEPSVAIAAVISANAIVLYFYVINNKAEKALRVSMTVITQKSTELTAVFDSLHSGICVIDADLKVGEQYSPYLENILQEKEIAGVEFHKLILDKSDIGPDKKQKIITAIEYTIGEDEMFFEVNSDCFLRDIKVDIDGHVKYIDLDWSPVLDTDDCVEKILLNLRDMTETLQLRQEAETGKRDLRYLGEVLKSGPDRFKTFEVSTTQMLAKVADVMARCESEQKMDKEAIKQVYVEFHTIKGAARFEKYIDFTDHVHHAEEIVSNKDHLDSEEFSKLAEYIATVNQSLDDYKRAVEPLFNIQSQINAGADLDENDINRLILSMEQSVNQLAQDLGKSGCKFRMEIPAGTLLQPAFHNALSKSLVHLFRNSIDHGLESAAEREKRDKPKEGTIRFFIDDQGRIGIEDDGKGLNLQIIRNKANSQGLKVSSNDKEDAELIFNSGLSTKDAANDVSGRGIGMDAVRNFMREVGSDISIEPKDKDGEFLRFYYAIDIPEDGLANKAA
ncbi:MAG: hypothetical protein CMP10_05370 [Zetaproteobacteria bacterium]|nr:hypothetical protein [Pseudobdellovibrionaceae bacterium]